MKERLLLDTHVWLWFGLGDTQRMKPASAQKIQEAAWNGLLHVSAMSIWEIGMLDARRRITLGREVDEWIAQALTLPGLQLTGLEPSIALDANRLPGDCHGDPSDRILIATARHLDATFMTADRQIQSYGDEGYLRVLKL